MAPHTAHRAADRRGPKPWTSAFGLAVLAAAALGCAREPKQPKGVLLLVVDTLRADALSLHGYGLPTSPHLDRFAAERGVVFESARSPAPWTKPAMASILTGLEPRQHGVTLHHHRLHSALWTLSEAFGSAGFDTAAVQSNMLLASVFGYDQGFGAYLEDHLASHSTSTGEGINAATLAWLDGRGESGKPWFLWVHHYEPHFDYLHWPGLTPDIGYSGRLTGSEPMDALIAATPLLGPEDVRFLRARYDGEVMRQDQLVGELLEGLDRRGQLEDTLIAFTSDHGEEFLEHGELSHRHKLFDVLLHVPLVIARPGERQPGRRVTTPVSTMDLGRTLLDLAGLDQVDFPGLSFQGLFGRRASADVPPALAHTATVEGASPEAPAELDMLLKGTWKLVRDHQSGERMLFDLERDRGETEDLARLHPERLLDMERELEQYLDLRRRRGGVLAPESVELTPEQEERMRKLGYF